MANRPPTRAELQAARREARQRFAKVRFAERDYARHLGGVGRNIGSIIRGFAARGRILDKSALQEALESYARLLRPWAHAVADRMIADVSARDFSAWRHFTGELGRSLLRDLREASTGALHRRLMDEQVELISSLPLDAAKQVHVITREALVTGKRAEEIAKEIEALGNVSVDRARLIARTEVGRTASAWVKVRAESIGSTQFTWMTVGDSDVRPQHRVLAGRVFDWNNPPVAFTGKGGVQKTALPGASPNCRCWASPVLPDHL